MESIYFKGKICPHCKGYFNAGRKNKTYCRSKCRYQSHNQKKRDPRRADVKIKKSLDRLYKSLQIMAASTLLDRSCIPASMLKALDYDDALFTSTQMDRTTGLPIYFIYDLGVRCNFEGETYWLYCLDRAGEPTAFLSS